MPKEHLFPLSAVKLILKIAEKEINFQLPDIFRESLGETTGGITYGEFKKKLLELNWTQASAINEEHIKKFIHSKNKEIKKKDKAEKKAKDGMKEKKKTLEKEKEREFQVSASSPKLIAQEKITPINSYTWAVLVKEVMAKGQILNLNNPRVKIARRLLFMQLINLEGNSPNDGRNLHESTQSILINFIGQLCDPLVNEITSAKVIHNFLYLANKTLEAQRKLGKTPEYLSPLFGGPLHDALELSGTIFGSAPSSPNTEKLSSDEIEKQTLQIASLNTREYKLFAKLTAIWMQNPIFSKPFNTDDYKSFRQDEIFFQTELEAYLQIEKMLSDSPMSLHQMCNTLLVLSSPHVVTSSETSSPVILSAKAGPEIVVPPLHLKQHLSKEKKAEKSAVTDSESVLMKKFSSVLNLSALALDPMASTKKSGSRHDLRVTKPTQRQEGSKPLEKRPTPPPRPDGLKPSPKNLPSKVSSQSFIGNANFQRQLSATPESSPNKVDITKQKIPKAITYAFSIKEEEEDSAKTRVHKNGKSEKRL